jgi:predicted transposase YbfD/YdcC
MTVDADDFDRIANTCAAQQADRKSRNRGRGRGVGMGHGITCDDDDTTDPGSCGSAADDSGNIPGADLVGVAVDAKAARGAKHEDATQVQLLAALRHDTGTVIGQTNVENDKTNEIVAFPALIEPLDLTGRVVTADAMHTQNNAARLVVTKGGQFVLGVKANQPKLWDAAVEAGNSIDIDRPEVDTEHTGHGRIDRHRARSVPVPATTSFPHAYRFIVVERESSTLDGIRVSIHTRF